MIDDVHPLSCCMLVRRNPTNYFEVLLFAVLPVVLAILPFSLFSNSIFQHLPSFVALLVTSCYPFLHFGYPFIVNFPFQIQSGDKGVGCAGFCSLQERQRNTFFSTQNFQTFSSTQNFQTNQVFLNLTRTKLHQNANV